MTDVTTSFNKADQVLKGTYVPKTEFDDLSKAFHEAATAEVQAFREVEQAKATMDAIGLRIELVVIKEAGGDEKKVGSTEAARQRAYELAKNDNAAYKAARDFYLDTKLDYRYHKHMLRLLDLRGQFIVACTSP